jgi:hypothetical protein
MMSTQESVEAALAILKDVQANSTEPPATVVMPPDSGDFIIGKRRRLCASGYRLAQGCQRRKTVFQRLSLVGQLRTRLAYPRPQARPQRPHIFTSDKHRTPALVEQSVGLWCAALRGDLSRSWCPDYYSLADAPSLEFELKAQIFQLP